MNVFQRQVSRLLVCYGAVCPYHRGKWRITELALKWSALQSGYTAPVIATRRQRRLELDLNSQIDRIIYFLNTYEAWDTLFLETVVQPGWTFFDLGANIGWYSLMASKNVGPDGKIFAFEIAEEEMAKLQRNIELNRATAIEPVLQAITDKPGTVVISNVRDAGATSLLLGRRDGREVPATSLDEFVAERRLLRLDFIKADIEGAEVNFLAGARQSLKRFRPFLMMELNPGALRRLGHDVQTLAAQLRSLEYHLFKACRHGLAPLTELPVEGHYINAVILPAELVGAGASLNWRAVAELGARSRGEPVDLKKK